MTAAVMMSEPDISDVLPQARQLVRDLKRVPGRNELKTQLRVGGAKASAVWRALLAEYPGPTAKPTRARTAEPAEASPAPGPSPVSAAGAEPDDDNDAERLRTQAPQASPAGPDPGPEPTWSPDPVNVHPDPSPQPGPAVEPEPLGVLDPDDTDPTWVGSGPVSPAGPAGFEPTTGAGPSLVTPGLDLGPVDDADWLDPWDYAEPVRPLPPVDPGPYRPEPAPSPSPATRRTEPTPGPDATPMDPEPTRPEPSRRARPGKPFPRWPLVVLALGAFVAVWSGWVGIGRLTGFGLVNLLPGFVDDGKWSTLDTAITLPIGVEAYGAFALSAFLSARIPQRARRFAGWSAAGSLLVGAAGQAAYHLLVSHPAWLIHNADGTMSAPAPIVVAVSALPVAVLGMGAALAHLMRSEES